RTLYIQPAQQPVFAYINGKLDKPRTALGGASVAISRRADLLEEVLYRASYCGLARSGRARNQQTLQPGIDRQKQQCKLDRLLPHNGRKRIADLSRRCARNGCWVFEYTAHRADAIERTEPRGKTSSRACSIRRPE